MKSKIENYLKMDLNPVAIIWSNDKPEKALQYKQGKYACAMHLVAQVAKGKTAVLDADTYGCVTAASAFGFGKFEDRWPMDMDYYYAFLSCGMKNQGIESEMKELITAASKQGAAPKNMVHLLMEGEGYKKSMEITKEVVNSWPVFRIKEKYVVMRPLKEADLKKEKPILVVFFGNPNQITALVKLANFRSAISDRVKISNGSACQDIGLFAYQESKKENPKAILGFFDPFARNKLKHAIGMDKLTFSIPMKLFLTMEEDADESLLVRDTWRNS